MIFSISRSPKSESRAAQPDTNRPAPSRHSRERIERQHARAALVSRRTVPARPASPGQDQLEDALGVLPRPQNELPLDPRRWSRKTQTPASFRKTLEMQLEQADAPPPHEHGLEQPVAVLQTAIATVDDRPAPAVDPDAHAAGLARSARSSPSAFARVSASSWAGLESATMPAPARNDSVEPCAVMVRIRMLKSQLPSRFR